MIRLGLAALLFSLIIMPLYPLQRGSAKPHVTKGVLKLDPGELNNGEIIPLDGKWEFFWNRLLKPGDLPPAAEYITIPSSWNFVTAHPAHGYATLALRITGLDSSIPYSLYVPDMITANEVWVNGLELWSAGKVGKSRAESRSQFLPGVVSFSALNGAASIVVQVSNFDFRTAGIMRSFELGKQAGIRKYREDLLLEEISIAAILLTLALFHLGVFAYRNQEKVELIFGLVCLTFVVRVLCTGEQFLAYFFPHLSWEVVRKLELIPIYVSAPLLALFMKSLFPEEIVKWIHRAIIGMGIALGIIVWILPIRFGSNLIPFMEKYIVAGLIYSLFVIVRASLKHRDGAVVILWAYLIFALAAVNDILYSSLLIRTFWAAPMGFVLFMVIQSQLLIYRYSRAVRQRDLLSVSRDHFRKASITDSLTGLFNARYLHSNLENKISFALSEGRPLSLIMADVDNFKEFNDTWGHTHGDEVLSKMGEIIKGSARENDTPCRYGGEEFSVILPDTTIERALEVAERIRSRFEEAGKKDERLHGITVTLGVSQYRAPERGDSLIERADKALYLAKKLGKNRVEKAE